MSKALATQPGDRSLRLAETYCGGLWRWPETTAARRTGRRNASSGGKSRCAGGDTGKARMLFRNPGRSTAARTIMPARRSNGWILPAAAEGFGGDDGEAAEGARAGAPAPGGPGRKGPVRRPRVAAGAALASLTHLSEPEGKVWKHLWSVLALAFAARAFVALSGDFALHPDEIMQYLEQAHRLVFGNGHRPLGTFLRRAFVAGARFHRRDPGACSTPWARPARLVRRRRQAGLLRSFPGGAGGDVLLRPPPLRRRRGPGRARGRSLLVRARRLRPQADDRVRGHRPADGVAGAVRAPGPGPAGGRLAGGPSWRCWRRRCGLQYAPLALALLGLLFLRAGGASGPGGARWRGARAQLAFAAALFFLAVGAFDALTWDAGPFHSYLANLRFNLALEARAPVRARPGNICGGSCSPRRG